MNKLTIVPVLALALLGGCRDNDDNGVTRRSSDSTLTRSGESASSNRDTTRNASGTNRTGSDSWNRQNQQDMNARSGTQAGSAASGTAYRSESQILSLIQQKNRQEVEVGELARAKAVSNEARTLADMLVNDHSQSQREVRQIADQLNIRVTDSMQPNQQGQSDHGSHADRLRNLGGSDFDREFGRMMLHGHADLIAQVESARANITSSQVRDLLDRTLQQLRKHEEQARRIPGVQG